MMMEGGKSVVLRSGSNNSNPGGIAHVEDLENVSVSPDDKCRASAKNQTVGLNNPPFYNEVSSQS